MPHMQGRKMLECSSSMTGRIERQAGLHLLGLTPWWRPFRLQLWRDSCPRTVKECFHHLQTGINDLGGESLSRVLAAFPGQMRQLGLPLRSRRFQVGLLSRKAPATALSRSISTPVKTRFRKQHLLDKLRVGYHGRTVTSVVACFPQIIPWQRVGWDRRPQTRRTWRMSEEG